MRLLLDTHALLWFIIDDPQLGAGAKAALLDPTNERWLSPASLIEIALKVRIGKLSLTAPFGTLFPAQLRSNDIHVLPVESRHIEPLTSLPLHHKDPFDRLIAATALVDQLPMVSVDAVLDLYGVTRIW
jgi:PIN domain nuclease of toxin-antitoxin system